MIDLPHRPCRDLERPSADSHTSIDPHTHAIDHTATIPEASEVEPRTATGENGANAAANDEAAGADPSAPRSAIEIGRSIQGATEIDLSRLLKTRLLIQAGSGGGKSWCLRRLIEQSYRKVRIIVFDPEGELVTLADKFDFTVCAPDSESNPIYPDGGAEAARAIFPSGRSTILSMSEFDGLEEMQQFVADFCRELLRMPASAWHHVVLVFDEAQLFAPQQDKAVSKKPLIDLTRRGRKRGMCTVAATQRLSELSKGVASHLENKMIGLTSLELDIVSAAKALGMRPALARQELRRLPNGHFICFGPALSFDLVETTVGPVATLHGSLEEYRGVAAAAAMSAETLGALLKSVHPAPIQPATGDETDVEGRGRHGKAWLRSSAARQRPVRRPRRTGPPMEGQRSLDLLGRSFDVACEIVSGRQIGELAQQHQVTEQSVRNWLRAAIDRIDARQFGIADGPLRVDLLRQNRLGIDTALRRARLSNRPMPSSQGGTKW